jgi:hypothetical protein
MIRPLLKQWTLGGGGSLGTLFRWGGRRADWDENEGAGTNGGWRAMNGTQRRLAWTFGSVFLIVALLVMVANATSSISDLKASGAQIPDHLVWSWEWSSIIAWLLLCPVIWWAVANVRPPRFGWATVAIALALGSVIASAGHILMMIAIRHVYYAATGTEPYRFFNVIDNRVLYEYRKDVTSYVQFVALAALAQWALARAATANPIEITAATLAVSDGTVTHHVPVVEIERVQSEGNYVEIYWIGRTLLHRATLTAVEAELGKSFVRIHRGMLVRRDAVRRIETDKSGDFRLILASGAEVRGSRRFRGGLQTI